MAFINLSLFFFCHFIVFIAHNYHYYFKGDYLYEHLASCCSIDVSVQHSVFMVHMHIYEMNTFLFISMGNVSKCLWWEPGKFVFFSFMNNIPMHGNSEGSTFPWSVLVMPSTDVLNITWNLVIHILYVICSIMAIVLYLLKFFREIFCQYTYAWSALWYFRQWWESLDNKWLVQVK
jgi:hypothetical protein